MEELVESLDWFYLRLTWQEIRALRDCAKAEELIKLEDPDTGEVGPLAESERRWIVTDKGRRYSAPRGAGPMDLIQRFWPTTKALYGGWKVIGALGALALVGVFGYRIESGGLMAEVLFIAALWLLVTVVLIGGLVNEWSLKAMARAWPRLEEYRPAAYAFVTARLPTPGPLSWLLALTVGAALAVCWRLAHHDKLTDPEWPGLVWALAVVAWIAIYFVHQTVSIHCDRRRRAYDEEHTSLRQRQFGGSGENRQQSRTIVE